MLKYLVMLDAGLFSTPTTVILIWGMFLMVVIFMTFILVLFFFWMVYRLICLRYSYEMIYCSRLWVRSLVAGLLKFRCMFYLIPHMNSLFIKYFPSIGDSMKLRPFRKIFLYPSYLSSLIILAMRTMSLKK